MLKPQTKLGASIGAAKPGAAPPAPASRFASALAGARVLIDVEVPRLGIAGKMTLVGAATMLAIEAELQRRMAERGLEATYINQTTFELERAALTLAEAIRDPADPSKPLGTATEWAELDADAIAALWSRYSDLREELDPLEQPLTEEDVNTIRDAIVKKNDRLLRSIGSRKLSRWLCTTAELPSSSATPRSSHSEPSEAT